MAGQGYHGITDVMVKTGTRRTWGEWFEVLDKFKSRTKGHGATVRYLKIQHHLTDFWAQAITFRYERQKGVRL